MRILLNALRKCWIMLTFPYRQDSNDSEADEGPLTKHRRLAPDFNLRILNMDAKGNKDLPCSEGPAIPCDASPKRSTREIGILCSVPKDFVSMNDKCIMVGTTGIAALKAKYGDDFTNFEIIQDVGYSSESSTHLSSDDVSDHIRIYSYSPTKRPYNCDVNGNTSLSRGTEYSVTSALKLFERSSLGSNSSHNDSGFGALELPVNATQITSPEECDEEYLSSSPGMNGDYFPESDFLDTMDFPNISECDNEQTDYALDGRDSVESLDNFQTRSSFTSSTHAFYKMTSVDSDYGDHKTSQGKESMDKYPVSSTEDELETVKAELFLGNSYRDCSGLRNNPIQNSQLVSRDDSPHHANDSKDMIQSETGFGTADEHSSVHNTSNCHSSEQNVSGLSDIECLPVTPCKTISDPQDSDLSEDFLLHQRYANHLCSTPYAHQTSQQHRQHWKNHRKGRRRRLSVDESYDSAKKSLDNAQCSCNKTKSSRSNRVREWLRHCPDGKFGSSASHYKVPPALIPDESASDDPHPPPPVAIATTVDSSCDASGEYTTTESDDESADYGGSHTQSGSAMGSVETVVPQNITTNFWGKHLGSNHDGTLPDSLMLLPPPPPLTPPVSGTESSTGASGNSIRVRKNGSYKNPERSVSEGNLFSTYLSEPRIKSFNNERSSLSGIKSANPEFIVPCMTTFRRSSESRRNTRLWRRSLPIVLCSESGQSESDVPTQMKSSGTLTSLGYSSDISHWQKSMSGNGRRSRKRSSSSSKCSSRNSSFIVRHRCGSRTTISASRGRHLSQSSIQQVDDELLSSQRSQETLAIAEDIPKSVINDVHVDIRRSPENDVTLTQFEEQSTVSDQVWDGYQEMPYLSETYSEPTVDEDAIRKLTEFGDDYCSAIGNQNHLGLGSDGRMRTEASAYPPETSTYFSKASTCQTALMPSISPVDSDSDIEDLHDILAETCRALQFARNTVNCRRDGKILSQAENAELLATCQTHLRCLEVISEHIEIDGKEKNFSHEDLVRLHDLIEEWAALQRTVVMNQQVVQSCDEKTLKAKRNIDDLYNKMAELSSANHLNPEDIFSLEDLKKKMATIQMALSTLQETKEQLLAVNIQVHRIVTETGDTSSPLKQDITELYKQWEDAYEENGNQLTDLQVLANRWQIYEKNYQKFISRLRKEQKCLQTSCDLPLMSDDDEEEDIHIEDQLKELQLGAAFLECRLRGSVVWTKISNDLQQLYSQIQHLKHQKRHHSESEAEDLSTLFSKTETDRHLDTGFEELDKDSQGTSIDAKLQPEEDSAELPVEAPEPEKRTPGSPSRLWRVLRAALPIQLALVFLYCLACALEPHCCDLLNNFNFSLSPQLRYVRGPPPV